MLLSALGTGSVEKTTEMAAIAQTQKESFSLSLSI